MYPQFMTIRVGTIILALMKSITPKSLPTAIDMCYNADIM